MTADTCLPSPSPDVLFTSIGGEIVLLDSPSGRYFGLNRTGAELWTMMQHGTLLTAAVEDLAMRFDVDRDRLRHDIEALVMELRRFGLVRDDTGQER